jgi:oxalate decarboxylase family bicupin protein
MTRNPSVAIVGRLSLVLATFRWNVKIQISWHRLTDSGMLPNLKFSFATARNRLLTGGWAREVTVRELPVASELAGVNMRLKPGSIREMHWHKEAEWAFMLAGRARVTAVDEQGRTFIDDVGEGDLWNFPSVIPHSIQGLEEGCEFLLVIDNGNFSENETFLLTDLFNHIPRDVLAKNLAYRKRRLPTSRPITNTTVTSLTGKSRGRNPATLFSQARALCRIPSAIA